MFLVLRAIFKGLSFADRWLMKQSVSANTLTHLRRMEVSPGTGDQR